jgi:subtilase family serine protease
MYFSDGTGLDENDIFYKTTGIVDKIQLLPGEKIDLKTSIFISAIPANKYYAIIKLDKYDMVKESNETNNTNFIVLPKY